MGTLTPEEKFSTTVSKSAEVEAEVEESFDPDDASKVNHRKIGVWDFYEPKKSKFRITNCLGFDHLEKLRKGIPHAVRLAKEVSQIPSCRKYLALYSAAGLVSSAVLPAFTLWSNARHLELTQDLLQNKPVEIQLLLCSLLVSIGSRVIGNLVAAVESKFHACFEKTIRRHFELKAMRILMSLDVPTFQDPGVQNQLALLNSTAGWESLPALIGTVSRLTTIITQGIVVGYIFVRQQSSTISLVNMALSALPTVVSFMQIWRGFLPSTTWAATCRDKNYIRMKGLKKVANSDRARQEIVAGNLQTHILAEWEEASGGVDGMSKDLNEAYLAEATSRFSFFHTFISPAMSLLPKVYICISVMCRPGNMAQTFASMQVLSQIASHVSWSVANIPSDLRCFIQNLENIEKLHEATTVKNIIADGTEPFALEKGVQGLAIEFRNVSFKYPRSDKAALENVSFTIPKGSMCVVVGTNGSGKSTLLKLLLRIYDPDEGSICIDGRDIKTLRLFDLRQTIATLFQSFSSFPLSIGEDIGMGDPQHARDMDYVTRAAELGGATNMIEKLPKNFNTFLFPPVADQYCMLPKGTKSLFGVKNIANPERRFGYSSERHSFSGGEYQRLALSRTFMRTINESRPIGLLLFDEPSAALDPEAEHALFERMIELRGQRTMIFSSHRFGKLTKYADIILYMKDSKLLEVGTHQDLLDQNGGYAGMYKVQAEAFVDKAGGDGAELHSERLETS